MNDIKLGDKVRINTDCGAPNAGLEGTVIRITQKVIKASRSSQGYNFTGYSVEIPELGITEHAAHELEKLPASSPVSIDTLLGAHLGTDHLSFIVTGRVSGSPRNDSKGVTSVNRGCIKPR